VSSFSTQTPAERDRDRVLAEESCFNFQLNNSLEVLVPCKGAQNLVQAYNHRLQYKERSPYLSFGFSPGPRPEMPFLHHSATKILLQTPATRSKLNSSFPSKTAVMQSLKTCTAKSTAQMLQREREFTGIQTLQEKWNPNS